MDFSKTASAISNVQHSAHLLDKEIKLVLKTLPAFTGGRQWQDEHTKRKMEKKLLRRIRSINKRKMTFERGFIAEEGLPRRSWYRHLGVAPGENLGVSLLVTCFGPFVPLSLSLLNKIVWRYDIPRSVSCSLRD